MSDEEAVKVLKSLINIAYGTKGRNPLYSDFEVIKALRIAIKAIEERSKHVNN